MITDSMMTITCRCGHEDDFMAFRSAPVTGELPRGRYQCPKCRIAWTVTTGPPRVGWSGMVLPGETQLREVAPVM